MNLTVLVQKIVARLRQRDVLPLLWRRLTRRSIISEFDQQHGTDTEGHIALWRLAIPHATAQFGSPYVSSPPERIRAALASIPRHCTFVDLGCGKGRILMIAAQLGFHRIVGVEFAPALVAIARENLRMTRTKAEVIEGDVSQYQLPDGPLCIYLFNPFTQEILAPIAAQLAARQEETWVVYVNYQVADPACVALLDGGLTRHEEQPGCVVWWR